MRRFGMLKVLKIVVFVALALLAFGFVTEHLWNWLMPAIFGLKAITFVQALGLVVLSKILLGGFHKHGGGGPRGWKRHMEERWGHMSPEERERLRAGMSGWKQRMEERCAHMSPEERERLRERLRGWRGGGWGPRDERTETETGRGEGSV